MKAKIIDAIQATLFIAAMGLDLFVLLTTNDENGWWHIPVICIITIVLYKISNKWCDDSIYRHEQENNPYMSQRNGKDHPEKA